MPLHVAAQFDSLAMFTILDNLIWDSFGTQMAVGFLARDREELKMMKHLTNRTKEG